MTGRKVFVRAVPARMLLNMSLVAIAALLCAAPLRTAHAQSTAARIYGQAPAGDTIIVDGAGGFHHVLVVGRKGKYMIHSLPLGVYRVKLMKNGKLIDMYPHVPLAVGHSTLVNFACAHDHCAAPRGSKN